MTAQIDKDSTKAAPQKLCGAAFVCKVLFDGRYRVILRFDGLLENVVCHVL